MRGQYERLGIAEFGEHLLTSGDLDPVYIALVKMELDPDQLKRWLIAYWCFYHCGLASWASEKEGYAFWQVLMEAAVNETESPVGGRWPRSSERRHARGKQGAKMISSLQQRYGQRPEEMVDLLIDCAPDYQKVASRVKEHYLFGDWISFKICDMIDRVLGVHIDFSEAAVFMFDDPVKAALILWRQTHGLPESAKPKDQAAVIHGVVEHLKAVFASYTAPPLHDRPVDLQEVETILCCWKSHLAGRYPLFNDIDEIRAGLLEWGKVSATAARMWGSMPEGSK